VIDLANLEDEIYCNLAEKLYDIISYIVSAASKAKTGEKILNNTLKH